MDLKFAVDDLVTVSGIAEDTGIAPSGVPIKALASDGKVILTKLHPPDVIEEGLPADANISPHYLVELHDAQGGVHNVWITEPRLSKV